MLLLITYGLLKAVVRAGASIAVGQIETEAPPKVKATRALHGDWGVAHPGQWKSPNPAPF